MPDKWDQFFLSLAKRSAGMSKDPRSQVGAVIVGPDREIRSMGFNGFPRGISDDARLNDRDQKLKLIVHAETNAILNASRFGVPLKGCTLYLAAVTKAGCIWAGPPCARCTVEIIQSGIAEIVSYQPNAVSERWAADMALSLDLMREAGIAYREVEVDEPFSDERQRVADYLNVILPDIGPGDDPVGFLIASHQVLSKSLRQVSSRMAGQPDFQDTPGPPRLITARF